MTIFYVVKTLEDVYFCPTAAEAEAIINELENKEEAYSYKIYSA